MNKKTYQKLYEELDSQDDISRISKKYSLNSAAVSNILHQKIVRNVRKYHSRVVMKAPVFVRSWQKGSTIMELAKKNNFPPVLLASIMLKEMGLKSKSVIKNPEILKDKRMKREINHAIDIDFCFSPRAHTVQGKNGRLGEELIHKWLEDIGLEFLTESDLNKVPDTKTPDFLLHDTISINGHSVKWIESKAVFVDEKEHRRYHTRQLKFYEELYGPGMVVYWYGYLDEVSADNYLITDFRFFEEQGYNVDRLLEYTEMK